MSKQWIFRGAIGLVGSAIAGSLCIFASWLPAKLGYCLNLTPSEPVGIYRLTNGRLTNGTLVLLQQPHGLGAASILRAYVPANLPLIKRVAAIVGDNVAIDAYGVRINGVLWPNSTPLTHDQQGRLLHPYRFGNYRVPSGELWVMSNHPRGLDSRYFGPISVARIISPLTPLATWSSPFLAQLLALAYAVGLAALAIATAAIIVSRLNAILTQKCPAKQEVL